MMKVFNALKEWFRKPKDNALAKKLDAFRQDKTPKRQGTVIALKLRIQFHHTKINTYR